MILDQRHDPAVPIDSIQEHAKNPRRGDEAAIEASIVSHGFYGAVLVQTKHDDGSPSGDILAGNHRHRMLKRSGEPTIPVLWVDVTDDEALRILLNDNPTSDKGGYDNTGLLELLKNLRATPAGLAGTGFDSTDLNALLSALRVPIELSYTQAANVPQYEVVGPQPALSELMATGRFDALIAEVGQAELPDDLARFLRYAAARHVVFNYRKVAEYYPHASAPVQRLMESSLLVIIDIDAAIARGYASLEQRLDEIRDTDAEG